MYHVFINHRGPDVKKTLASVIYHYLKLLRLRVFLDEKEFHDGDSIYEIFEAIRSASVHIIIFSKCYAESHWCLDELCSILEARRQRRTRILPVFFDVNPKDLRHIENGCYAKALADHQRNGTNIEKWKTALKEASDIVGEVFKTNESDVGKVCERIAEEVLKESSKWEQLEVARHPVGLKEAEEDFQNEITKQALNGTIIVGIAGIAGVGKSTLAKYLYNLKRPDFSRSCFLWDVRKSKDRLPSLQQKILHDILGDDKHLDSTCQGNSILKDRLSGLRVLIVFDDVDHIDQVNSVLDIDLVGSDSLILITSSDRELLLKCSSRKTKTVLYDVKLLNRMHACELFCWHACLPLEQYKGFEDLVNKFLKICNGLPLSLQVLGAQLKGNTDRRYWEQQLESSLRRLPGGVENKLKLSCEGLNNEEMEMFLDVACFFVGEDKELAIRVLEGLGRENVCGYLEKLHQKCLIEYHYDVQSHHEIECRGEKIICNCDSLYLPPTIKRCKITMHDQVKALARQISGEGFRGKPLRLSCSNDIEKILQLQLEGGSETFKIRGIRKDRHLPADCRNKIKGVGVRVLVVEGPVDLSSFFDLWDIEGALAWLRLRNVRSISFPRSISLGRLRVLELHGHADLTQLLDRFEEPPSDLRELSINITDTLPSTSSGLQPSDLQRSDKIISDSALQRESTPYNILLRFFKWIGTKMKMLNKIELKNIASLQELPIDFSEVKNLRHLDLSGCTDLKILPKSLSKLKHLQYLSLRDCKNLSIPTDILGEISSLEYVDFKGCAQLVSLPRAIMTSQSSLRYLNVLETHLSQLPVNFNQLHILQQLRIGSSQLTEFPDSLGDLRRLEELILIQCRSLTRIPEEIAASNIKVLVIAGSPLIDSFHFQNQRTMHVGMPVLRDFTLKNTSISHICIPEGNYPSLETVDLSRNSRLMQIDGLPSRVVRLNLQNCEELKRLPNLSYLPNLKFLNVSECLKLKTMNVEGLISLEEIKAAACWKLKSIEGLRQRLNCLHISTDEGAIWNNIYKYLTLPSHEKLSTAIFSGMADDKKMPDMQEVSSSMMEKFQLQMLEIVCDTTRHRSHVKITDFHSHGAILMCFVTSTLSDRRFDVTFDASNYGGPVQKYTTRRGNGSGKSLDVFIWGADSNLFREYEGYGNIDVYCPELCVNALDPGHVEWGWMVMVDKNTDIPQVCHEFINAFAKKFIR